MLLAGAKQQARIDTTADDSLVTNLIIGARLWGKKWWDGERRGPITGLD